MVSRRRFRKGWSGKAGLDGLARRSHGRQTNAHKDLPEIDTAIMTVCRRGDDARCIPAVLADRRSCPGGVPVSCRRQGIQSIRRTQYAERELGARTPRTRMRRIAAGVVRPGWKWLPRIGLIVAIAGDARNQLCLNFRHHHLNIVAIGIDIDRGNCRWLWDLLVTTSR